MSRAFVKEDDGEQGNAISEIQRREGKIEWLKIQEKKLARLLEASEKGTSNDPKLQKWIDETKIDIEKTRTELGYSSETD